VWLAPDPLDEHLYVGMSFEGLERVVRPLKFLIVEDSMYVPMTRRTEVDRLVNLPPIERLLVALVFMTRSGDEVVSGEPLHCSVAETAGPALHTAVHLAHVLNLSIASFGVE